MADLSASVEAQSGQAASLVGQRETSWSRMKASIPELTRTFFRFWPVRAVVALLFFGRGLALLMFDPFDGVTDLAWVFRVSRVEPLASLAYRIVTRMACDGKGGENRLVTAFLNGRAPMRCKRRFLGTSGNLDPVFRDAMVLKPFRPGEKGVLLLKYTAKFDLFVALFDLDKLTRDYYLVLEPCWSGYCDPSILMFLSAHNEVIVQSPDRADYEFIQRLRGNLVPVTLGASDWVDPDLFTGDDENGSRPHDLVMVAHWGRLKNHRRLFEALQHVRRRPVRILLIGFPWAGRTAQDILQEIRRYDLRDVEIEIQERLAAPEVAAYLRRSKVFVLLSEKEGANKALVEALFCGVRAIVYDRFVGGAAGKMNAQTGMLASFEALPGAIERMLEPPHHYSPRAWALQHSGSRNATRELNRRLKSIAEAKGEPWTLDIVEKVNRPNLAYKVDDALPRPLQTSSIAAAYLRKC